MTWMDTQKILDLSRVGDDKTYSVVDEAIAEKEPFLQNATKTRRLNWVDNYNKEREAALYYVEHLFIRT